MGLKHTSKATREFSLSSTEYIVLTPARKMDRPHGHRHGLGS